MSDIAFVDIETTGLDPDSHEILEVAILKHSEDSFHFSLPIDTTIASAQALEINKYYERHRELMNIQEISYDAAAIIQDALKGCIFVGNNPQFDAAFLRTFLRKHYIGPPWHYHLVDIKALVAGFHGIRPPWSSDLIAEVSGVPLPHGAHTALADCRWNKEVYDSLAFRR